MITKVFGNTWNFCQLRNLLQEGTKDVHPSSPEVLIIPPNSEINELFCLKWLMGKGWVEPF